MQTIKNVGKALLVMLMTVPLLPAASLTATEEFQTTATITPARRLMQEGTILELTIKSKETPIRSVNWTTSEKANIQIIKGANEETVTLKGIETGQPAIIQVVITFENGQKKTIQRPITVQPSSIEKMTADDFKATGADALHLKNDFIKHSESEGRAPGGSHYSGYYKARTDTRSDVITTNRGISPGYSTWQDVKRAYGYQKLVQWNKGERDRLYSAAYPTDSYEKKEWHRVATYVDYGIAKKNSLAGVASDRYTLRFYFDTKDNLVFIFYSLNYHKIK